MRFSYNHSVVSIVWFLVLGVAMFVFWPALAGPFLFDDYGSLGKLGDLGGVRDKDTFLAFVLGGGAGPTGRPIALLSFLIDGQTWPTSPWPFKRTNLLIHLLNGTLIAILSAQVLSLLSDGRASQKRNMWIAISAAAMWLLHPFLISTTFYVVQRMAQLSALFSFAGLVGYLYGRKLIEIHPLRGYLWMSVSLVGCTLLALFSKENGALLPMLVWVVESTVVAASKKVPPLKKTWYWLFLVVPSLLIFAYLARHGLSGGFFEVFSIRGVSPYERLLTEGRILFDYLWHWFVPQLMTAGLYHDQFLKSTTLISPLSTLAAASAHIVIILLALLKRKQWPLVAFAVLFFYVAHLLESSILMLELYFEHRNYLATAFLLLPVCYWLSGKLSPWINRVAVLSVVFILASFSYYAAGIWSSYPSLSLAWAQKAPGSSRAQQQASMVLFNHGRHTESLAVLDDAINRIPRDYTLRVWKIVLACKLNQLKKPDIDVANNLAKETLYDLRVLEVFRLYVDVIGKNSCSNLSAGDGIELFANMLKFPDNADPRSAAYSQLQYLMGNLAVYQQKPADAVVYFRQSLAARPGPDPAMNMAAFLATHGYFTEALLLSEDALDSVVQGDSGATGKGAEVFMSDIKSFQDHLRSRLVKKPIINQNN